MQVTGDNMGDNGDATDLLNLGQRLGEALQQLSLKRTTLDETRQELHASYMEKHELERLLDRERRDAQELRLQMELSMTAARRWEEERVSVKEAGTRQRVQLEAAVHERNLLFDQGRDLQMENMKLRQQIEEHEAQLRCQAAYNENNVTAQNKVRSMHDQINKELNRLQSDHERLEKVFEVAQVKATETLVTLDHRNCMREHADKERAALEQRIAKMGVELDGLYLASKTIAPAPATSHGDSAALKELVFDMEHRLVKETECSANLLAMHLTSLKQQAVFEKLQNEAHEKLISEHCRNDQLVEKNGSLTDEASLLKENLRSVEQVLCMERERARKAECVERGVQCDGSELQKVKQQKERECNEVAIDLIPTS